jgi:hypothetical protein
MIVRTERMTQGLQLPRIDICEARFLDILLKLSIHRNEGEPFAGGLPNRRVQPLCSVIQSDELTKS